MIKPKLKNQDAKHYVKHTSDTTFLLFRRKGLINGMFIQEGRLVRVSADDENINLKGMICIAKVIDVVKNIDAAFVRLPDKRKCFVPFSLIDKSANLSGRETVVQGDNLLLQITQNPAKGKEASGSTILKLDGNYCVITKGSGNIKLSHKIDKSQQSELDNLITRINTILPQDLDVILRTAVVNLDNFNICFDECFTLINEMKDIINKAYTRTDYSILKFPLMNYQELLLEFKNHSDFRILTEDAVLYDELISFLDANMPEHKDNCSLYSDKMVSLTTLFSVEKKLSEALNTKVWLDNGAFLYIEPTQALTVIDVNSGKFSDKCEAQEYYLKVNLSAAEEIARQIVLRNISGIIIIDFINMKKRENNVKLMNYLKELLQNDTNSAQIIDITKLGLVEITRKKTGKTIYEQILM